MFQVLLRLKEANENGNFLSTIFVQAPRHNMFPALAILYVILCNTLYSYSPHIV